MYRDDRDAMLVRLDQLSRERESLSSSSTAMREEIIQLRQALSRQPTGNPYRGMVQYGPGERAALGAHTLEAFPVWAVAILHIFTFGLFSLIWFGLQHGRMPRAAHDDPSAGTAIGFQFIPFFNYYWIFFNPLRLCDRLNLQFKLRQMNEEAPRGLVMAASVGSVIPYFNFLIAFPVLFCIANCMMQASINKIVEAGPVRLDAPDHA
jgi:hypothetical protein